MDENTRGHQFYTTGTTGRPKGVYFTHRQLTVSVGGASSPSDLGNDGGVTNSDVYMPLTPMFHVHAWGMPYMATMFWAQAGLPGQVSNPRCSCG